VDIRVAILLFYHPHPHFEFTFFGIFTCRNFLFRSCFFRAFYTIPLYPLINLLLFVANLEHLKRIQSNGLNQSMESLSCLMPSKIDKILQDQEEDRIKMATHRKCQLYLYFKFLQNPI